ncbi:MAG TPA: 30S ribosomal protein S20 [Calditrichaeota bacterium]|nr:30S ribosomal protein S20 [Calditrichota bacterium]
MAHHKSAIKRIRTAEKARSMNRFYKRRLKIAVKELLESETKADAEPKLKKVFSLLDRLALKNIIHRNKAANQKARLSRFVNKLS